MEAFLEDFKHLKIQLQEIKSATCNFDNSNVIGQGGFGKVYQGVLSHSKGQSTVAFKRLDRRFGQGDPEFLKEILMLSRYTHENLISLLGFCDEDGEKILVYEYASHGSLYHHLSSTTLTWRQRLKICLGAAKGLCYLHDPKETQQRVLHRDIKSSNILLDENWNAKVSDMGLSKIGPANQQYSFLATNVVGTFGYIDPLYVEKSILTKESDVYSFGVVLFEVLCGRRCFEKHNDHFQSLVRTWKQSYKQKKLDEIILQDLKRHMDPKSLETYSEVAYRCLHRCCEERPTMSHVVEKLEIAHRFQEISEDYEEMRPIPEAPYQTVNVIFDDPGVQELVAKLYHKEWSEGQVTEYLVATFADYFTDVKMSIEEISFRRFFESCLERTVILYVDHLLAQKNYIKEETIERMRLDEEVLMDFFTEYISVNEVENRLRILIDLRELASAESPDTFTLVYTNILEHQPDCPPDVVERIVGLREGIPRKVAKEVVQECKEIYENSLIDGNPPRTGFVFSKLKSLTESYENSLIDGNPPRTGFVFSKLKSLTESRIGNIFRKLH